MFLPTEFGSYLGSSIQFNAWSNCPSVVAAGNRVPAAISLLIASSTSFVSTSSLPSISFANARASGDFPWKKICVYFSQIIHSYKVSMCGTNYKIPLIMNVYSSKLSYIHGIWFPSQSNQMSKRINANSLKFGESSNLVRSVDYQRKWIRFINYMSFLFLAK